MLIHIVLQDGVDLWVLIVAQICKFQVHLLHLLLRSLPLVQLLLQRWFCARLDSLSGKTALDVVLQKLLFVGQSSRHFVNVDVPCLSPEMVQTVDRCNRLCALRLMPCFADFPFLHTLEELSVS